MHMKPPSRTLEFARKEAEDVMFGSLDNLFSNTNIKPEEIGILVVNCSLFNTTPSFTDVIINKYKMKSSVKSFDLSGMGCSAGVISVDLAKGILQYEDDAGKLGVFLSKSVMPVAGLALRTNITTLGPLVLPLGEKLRYLIIIDEIENNLKLSPAHAEASRMTLHRFGNTSSSTIWYELAYIEAKGWMGKNNRIWQIALGGGFKCNRAVLVSLKNVKPSHLVSSNKGNPWEDCIHKYFM
ncbi:hypothetical protein C5167_014936 [Papaver somniferum]|uniref:FAE domain-containing protein n=1 Tax=Papaver somniferum TaxID=3469 RepID=A0A4Y7J835_PAPSO|nr:hypothetical protein C5167_014936 [Papaver somniferum]